jgi:hypothetical protein
LDAASSAHRPSVGVNGLDGVSDALGMRHRGDLGHRYGRTAPGAEGLGRTTRMKCEPLARPHQREVDLAARKRVRGDQGLGTRDASAGDEDSECRCAVHAENLPPGFAVAIGIGPRRGAASYGTPGRAAYVSAARRCFRGFYGPVTRPVPDVAGGSRA